jgi:hypothetical protein
MHATSRQRVQGTGPKESPQVHIVAHEYGENISVVSCGNAMGTAVLHFVYISSLLLYLNSHVFRRNIWIGYINSFMQVIRPIEHLSDNNYFLAPMMKDKDHNIFLM